MADCTFFTKESCLCVVLFVLVFIEGDLSRFLTILVLIGLRRPIAPFSAEVLFSSRESRIEINPPTPTLYNVVSPPIAAVLGDVNATCFIPLLTPKFSFVKLLNGL
jgi:hypothetical protein